MKFVDVAIPTNNKAKHSIGLIWWLLAREVLRLRGTIPRTSDGWNVMVDMFFYRDPEEVEKQQQEEAAAKLAAQAGEEPAAGLTEWDVASGPAAGAINPALVSQEGGMYTFFLSLTHSLTSNFFQQLSIGLLTLLPDLLTGPQSLQVLDGVLMHLREVLAGIKSPVSSFVALLWKPHNFMRLLCDCRMIWYSKNMILSYLPSPSAAGW